ncbi:response regulator [Bacillus pumilus]|nr:hypothetical protein [Bacillus pumilus]
MEEIKEGVVKWWYDVYGIDDFQEVMEEFSCVEGDVVIIDIEVGK